MNATRPRIPSGRILRCSVPPGPSLRAVLAFLVLSHRDPAQVLRLVRALSEEEQAAVAVRHDQRRSTLEAGDVEAAGGSPISDGHEVGWGDLAYVRMILDALQTTVRTLGADWVVTVSGQDYPLRPPAELERHLGAGGHQALLFDSWPLDLHAPPQPPKDEFFRRYRYRHYPMARRPARLIGRALGPLAYQRSMPAGSPDLLGLRPPRHPFGPGLRCHVSGDWLMVDRQAIESMVRFARDNTAVMRHYARTAMPGESFFATALANDPAISVGPSPRAIRFQPGAAHPDTYGEDDVPELLASGAYLGRKFDESAEPGTLDRLDEARRRGQAGSGAATGPSTRST